MDKQLVFSLAKTRFPTWDQFQYLPNYLDPREKTIVRTLTIVVIICLLFISARFYSRHVAAVAEDGGTYTEAIVGQPKLINPILAQTNDSDMDISRLVTSSLFKYDTHQMLVPDIATKYEISADQKVYTVIIRQDALWHNGNSLLVDDILFTIDLIQDPEFSSPLTPSLKGVIAEKVDDQTIKFTLKEPFSPFLSNLTFGILPAHIWADVTAANFPLAEYNIKPIGSGPYKFKSLTKDRDGNIRSYTLAVNDQYYGMKPHIKEINLRFYPDFQSAVDALRSNAVDGASFIPKDLQGTLEKNKRVELHRLQLPQYTGVFFNQKNALLKEKAVRQALVHAADQRRIVDEALGGRGTIIHAPILEGFLGFNPDAKGFAYDPELAKKILDDAGWKISEEDGLRKKGSTELRFSLTTVDQAEYLKTADLLKEAWEAIGIGIELKIMNPARVDKEVIKPRNYEAFLYGEIIGFDPDPFPFWHSSQTTAAGLNLSNYFNKQVDTLLEDARKTSNPEERAKKYIEFQNILLTDLPALFLYSPTYLYGVKEDIKGFTLERITIPSDRFIGIENWYIKTKREWH